jgi:hypothetical protein
VEEGWVCESCFGCSKLVMALSLILPHPALTIPHHACSISCFLPNAGAYHGFTDNAMLHLGLQLCWEYGNSFYAFKNLANSKSR